MTGHQLALRRKECGWSQYDLARIMGVGRTRIAAYEQDRASVPPRVAKAITAAAKRLGPVRTRVESALAQDFTEEPLEARCEPTMAYLQRQRTKGRKKL